ncbi:MAG: exopolyphosphatase [Oryzomicrobium sp.]|nr:exopolyphosphatase [Oryzomicrobium sp.]MCE1242471.1 exopolyphosphatase [Oryzomicrobium sp.]
MQNELIAAVDLGSNSFRLEVGRVVDDQIYTLDSLKEAVRLASGLTAERYMDDASQRRALDALAKFGERIRGFPPEKVRAVATNTLRVAKNAGEFLQLAEAALGFPIEIIAGREEARLIYIGAAHSLPQVAHKRLVVDIGGGSTEFIIGKRFDPMAMESLYMGCVSYTGRFFPDGRIDKKRFREAEVAAGKEIQTIAHDYLRQGWKEAVGSSGSARAIADVLELNGLNPGGAIGITRAGMERMKALLIKAGSLEALDLEGLKSDRLPVIPGGLAIMMAVFQELNIERMTYADGALRLGVLYDLLGRFHHSDMRDATVTQFMRRYQVDSAQAGRVEQVALTVFRALTPGRLDTHPVEHVNDEHFLCWAARLHELGLSVAHNGYHKHGAYILTFADMPGFSKKEQARLAMLVLGHKGKLQKVGALPYGDVNWLMVFALRLATILMRSRESHPPSEWGVRAGDKGFLLELPGDWLAANPLTAAALDDEAEAWRGVGLTFRLKPRGRGERSGNVVALPGEGEAPRVVPGAFTQAA